MWGDGTSGFERRKQLDVEGGIQDENPDFHNGATGLGERYICVKGMGTV